MWIDVSFSHGKRFLMYEPGVEYFYGFDVVCVIPNYTLL